MSNFWLTYRQFCPQIYFDQLATRLIILKKHHDFDFQPITDRIFRNGFHWLAGNELGTNSRPLLSTRYIPFNPWGTLACMFFVYLLSQVDALLYSGYRCWYSSSVNPFQINTVTNRFVIKANPILTT